MRAHGESMDVDEWVVYATSALREAENGAEVVDQIEAETGVGINVITGLDEARLIFAAVRASVLIDKPPAVCIDQGGGSLEVSVGDASGMLWATSVKLGAARLTAEFVRTTRRPRTTSRACGPAPNPCSVPSPPRQNGSVPACSWAPAAR